MNNNPRDIERYIFKYVNDSRKKAGLKEFRMNRGLVYLSRRHSHRMAKQRHMHHGENVFIAKEYIHEQLSSKNGSFFEKIILVLTRLFSFTNIKYRGISGENVAIMFKGKVKDFQREILSDKDIARALHIIWMKSPRHKANILNSDFKLLGIGIKRRGKAFYATEVFFG